MAELFFKQGHLGRALGIYRHVVREHPENLEATARLRELEEIDAKKRQTGKRGSTMGYREEIERVVKQTPGATACMIVGYDGIPLDTYQIGGAEVDIMPMIIEYSTAITALKNTLDDFTTIKELSIANGEQIMILRPLNHEFLLITLVNKTGLTGKARYLMRLAHNPILAEIV